MHSSRKSSNNVDNYANEAQVRSGEQTGSEKAAEALPSAYKRRSHLKEDVAKALPHTAVPVPHQAHSLHTSALLKVLPHRQLCGICKSPNASPSLTIHRTEATFDIRFPKLTVWHVADKYGPFVMELKRNK